MRARTICRDFASLCAVLAAWGVAGYYGAPYAARVLHALAEVLP